MTFYDLVIRGNIVLENEVILGEIGINDEKIHQITTNLNSLKGKEIIEFQEEYIFPGMIDVHTHCYSNPNEGFKKTSLSAAIGGITSFLDMPYDDPDPVNNLKRFKEKIKHLEKSSVVDIGLYATISKRNGTDQIKILAKAGAIAFKLSTFEVDEKRFPSIPDDEIIKAMKEINQSGKRVVFHAENEEIIKSLIKEFKDNKKVYPLAHSETRPPVTETSSVLKLLEFAYWTKTKLHIAHASHPRTIELVNIFRNYGVDVTVETCHNHLLLDTEDFKKLGPRAKINPPLRNRVDVLKLWNHLKKGKIDIVSSDHSPWDDGTKQNGNENIFLSTSGLAGLEIIVPLMFYKSVIKGRITPTQFARFMAVHPAEVFQIPDKGKIKVGFDADFTVIHPKKEWIIDGNKFKTRSKITPYQGKKIIGKVVKTIIRGRPVYDGKEVLVNPGFGKFIKGKAYNIMRS